MRVTKKRCRACNEILTVEDFSPCGAGKRRGVCRGCYAAQARVARLVRRDPRARHGIVMGTVAAETLDDTIAVLHGMRVEIDMRIEALGRMRSAEALLDRAREENGGLPETAAAASQQSDEGLHEVRGTPGRLAIKASRDAESARLDSLESGEVEQR